MSSLPGDWHNPDWTNKTKVHDWKNYANIALKMVWGTFKDKQKMAVSSSLQLVADSEHWE